MIAVLAAVFALGHVIGSRGDAPPAGESAHVSPTPPKETVQEPAPKSPSPRAHAPEPETSSADVKAKPRPQLPYLNLDPEWEMAYDAAIKAVRSPDLNPLGRELDEACLKTLEPMVRERQERIRVAEDAKQKAVATYLDWKEQHKQFDTTPHANGSEVIYARDTTPIGGKVQTKPVLVSVRPGESAEVDAAIRALADEHTRYAGDVAQFIASCGR